MRVVDVRLGRRAFDRGGAEHHRHEHQPRMNAHGLEGDHRSIIDARRQSIWDELPAGSREAPGFGDV